MWDVFSAVKLAIHLLEKGENEMNWDQIKGKWKQTKGQIQQKWGELTDDELDVINGQRQELVNSNQCARRKSENRSDCGTTR